MINQLTITLEMPDTHSLLMEETVCSLKRNLATSVLVHGKYLKLTVNDRSKPEAVKGEALAKENSQFSASENALHLERQQAASSLAADMVANLAESLKPSTSPD